MTSPDLAANGWTVQKQDAPYTPYVRVGEIDWTIALPSANTYRSSLVNGLLVLQLPAGGGGVQVGKAIGDTVARSYVAHAWSMSDTDHGYVWCGNTQNFLESTKYTYYTGLNNLAQFFEVLATGPSTFSDRRVPAAVNVTQQNLVKYLHIESSPQAQGRAQALTGLDGRSTSVTALSAAPTVFAGNLMPTHAGMWFTPTTQRQFVFVDFLRRQPVYRFP